MFHIRRFSAALVALALLLAAFGAHAFVWFGDERGLHRLDPLANVIDLDVQAGESVAAATDPSDGSVWSISRTRIVRYSTDGFLVFSRSFASLPGNFGNARKLAVNPADSTAWVAGDRRVARLGSGDGGVLTVLPGEATDIAVAQDGTLWVLDEDSDELRLYASEGALLQRVALGGASRRAHHLALDSVRGFAWFVANRAIVKRSAVTPMQVLQRIDVSHGADAACAVLETGDLWVLGDNALHGYRADGTPFATQDLGNYGIANASSLACDHGSRSIWVGHRRGVSQFSRTGGSLWTASARDSNATAVAREAMSVRPHILSAWLADGGMLTNPQPLISFEPGALCAGNDCEFDPRSFEAYTYVATLDATEIGSLLVRDPESGEMRFQPAAPLADGTHTVTAQAVDGSGNRSEPVTLTFETDTTPPTLVTVNPPSGTHFQLGTEQIFLDATFDASATSVWIDGAPPRPGKRVVSVVQVSGRRTVALTLHAADAAGNVASVPVVYTVDQLNRPPVVRLLQPAPGQVFEIATNIAVEADATDSDGTIDRVEFYREGTLIATVTAPPYRALIPAVSIGTTGIGAVAWDNENRAGSAGVTVKVTGPPLVTILTPQDGGEMYAGSLVRVALMAAPDRTIELLEVMRNGVLIATIPHPNSPYQIGGPGLGESGVVTMGFRAIDNTGASTLAETTFTVKPFDIVVEYPLPNAEVTVGTVRIEGRYFGPTDTVIRANGMPVFVTPTSPDGGTFALGFIPLAMGPRVIEVELSSPSLAIGRGYSIPITVVGVVIVPPPPPPPVGGGAG